MQAESLISSQQEKRLKNYRSNQLPKSDKTAPNMLLISPNRSIALWILLRKIVLKRAMFYASKSAWCNKYTTRMYVKGIERPITEIKGSTMRLNRIVPVMVKRMVRDLACGHVFVWDFETSEKVVRIFDVGHGESFFECDMRNQFNSGLKRPERFPNRNRKKSRCLLLFYVLVAEGKLQTVMARRVSLAKCCNCCSQPNYLTHIGGVW